MANSFLSPQDFLLSTPHGILSLGNFVNNFSIHFFLIFTFCICLLLKIIFHTNPKTKKLPLPPGPKTFSVIGNLLWLRRDNDFAPFVQSLKAKHGPIMSFKLGPVLSVVIANHSLAYKSLVQAGTVFSDRPEPGTYPACRKGGDGSFSARHALPAVFMCFGEKLPEHQIQEIESTLHHLLGSFNQFHVFAFFPRLGKLLFRRKRKQMLQMRKDQEQVLIPHIRARIESKDKTTLAYLDTLVDLQLPEDKRKPEEGELVSLCSEFLNVGTDTTATVLQWIMANLVKHPEIQEKLYEEIIQVMGLPPDLKTDNEEEMRVVEEEDLERMVYLKAIVLEGLRRHPPGHFVLPHAVTEDVILEGYLVPKNAMVSYMVAEIGWDPEVWEDPVEFKPERFLTEKKEVLFDITSSREIKMIPFGAWRRMCPAANTALIQLEYFVANLIWYLDWKEVKGQEVDLSEKQEFTIVMKNALTAPMRVKL